MIGQDAGGQRPRLVMALIAAVLGAATSGCATVPDETVALSVAVGEDIRQLHTGYRSSVQLSFQQMRQAGLTVIEEVWTPAYLATFVREGELMEIAAEQNWQDLEAWARAAIEDIDAERSMFLDSLAARETALLDKIDDAFARTMSANHAVTAYLNSVLKVQEVQDQVLSAAGLGGLREEIATGMAEASAFAARTSAGVRAATGRLDPPDDTR